MPTPNPLVEACRRFLMHRGSVKVDDMAMWVGVSRRTLHLLQNQSLVDGGTPFFTAGAGLMLATQATPEERNHAAARRLAMATALRDSAYRILGQPVPGEPVQIKMWSEDGGSL